MRTILCALLVLPFITSISIEGVVSSALDFVPVVGNVKSLGEAVMGKDLVTGEDLSITERTLSLLGAVPGGNLLKNSKHLKNGQKFFKAAQRAQQAGKMKNAVNFAKAGARAMAKAEKVPKIVSNVLKGAKAFFKGSGTEEEL